MQITSSGETFEPEVYQDDNILEAKAQGFDYIELELNPQHVRGRQPLVLLSGVMVAEAFQDGIDDSGLEKSTVLIKGGSIAFSLNPRSRRWEGDLLDDKITAEDAKRRYGLKMVSEFGYNRDWLASHVESNHFTIKNPEVRRDVMNRYKKKLGEPFEEIQQPMTESEKKDMEIAELKKELQEQKELVKEVVAIKRNKPGRPAKKREPTERMKEKGRDFANDTQNDNDVAEGSQRVEPDGGQGDPPGTE